MAELSETVRLLEQTSARLCHDLGGLIGTVGNALDMLAEDGGGNEILAFAVSANKALTERLRLLRTAWGPNFPAMAVSGLAGLVGPQLAARRIGLDSRALRPDSALPPLVGRVLLNLIMLAADCLPRAGTIVLIGQPADLLIRIAGEGAAWPAGFAGCMHDEAAALAALRGPGAVQMPLTVLFALSGKLPLSPVLSAAGGIEAVRLGGG